MDPETECACTKPFGIHSTHKEFVRQMETKVVVATTWIPVGIDSDIPGSQLLSDIQPDGHSNLVFDDYRQKSSSFYFSLYIYIYIIPMDFYTQY